MKRLWLWFSALQRGHALADPAKWRKRQITASALVGAIYAVIRLAESYGITIPADHETVDAAAVAILAVVNVLLTAGTDPEVGLPSRGNQSLMDQADRASHSRNSD